jgi:uncharacterized protein (DUF2126 family)
MAIKDETPWPNDAMLRHSLYSDPSDRKKHFGAIQSLADDLHRPVPEVVQMYEEILEHLQDQARITDYLPILVSKKVREICRPPH